MPKLIDDLRDIKLAIFDLDGVVYRGHNLIPNADKVIQQLKDSSIEVVYNSNNSTITREMYVEKLKRLGIPSEYEDFYTSASITAAEMTKIKENANFYIIGEIGIREELKALGHEIIKDEKRYKEVDFVIAGLDVKFNYNKLRIAQKCILEGGAEFYATNPDKTLPMPEGLWPGAGVMVNSVATCTGKEPIKIFGKPQPDGINLILRNRNVDPQEACIFGDRLDTDILAGNQAKIISVCVLTGIATKEMIEQVKKNNIESDLIPDLVIKSLEDIIMD